MDMLIIFIMVIVSQSCTYVKMYQIIYLKYMKFIVHLLYLN
jgi:hypothetical protein